MPEDTVFIPQTRKEVSRVAFHLIDDLPNTYGVHAFIPKLKRWISTEGKRIKLRNLGMGYVTHVNDEKNNIYTSHAMKNCVATVDRFHVTDDGSGPNCLKALSRHECNRKSYFGSASIEYMLRASFVSNIRHDTSMTNEFFKSSFELDKIAIMSHFDFATNHLDIMSR